MPIKLTTEILSAAVAGFEEQKKRIDVQVAGLRQMLAGGSTDGETGHPQDKLRLNHRAKNLKPMMATEGAAHER
jgi:hypothetical protein